MTLMVVFSLVFAGGLKRLEWMSFDWRSQLLRQSASAPDDVAVILIDEAAISAMNPVVGRWPWPRSVHADVVDFLAMGQPRAVLFDILFTENELQPGQEQSLSPQDRRLIDASRDAGMVIHAMQVFRDSADEANNTVLDRPLPDDVLPTAITDESVTSPLGRDHDNNNYYLPFPGLYQAAGGLGVVNTEPDDDGVYRRVKLLHKYQQAVFPSLGVAPLLADRRQPLVIDGSAYQINGVKVPVAVDGSYLINHYGHINTWSMSGVLASAQQLQAGDVDNLLIDPREFQNKIVFIGASATGLEDLKTTPMGSAVPGVFLHAAVTANLLAGDVLVPVPNSINALLIIMLAVISVLGVLGMKRLPLQLAVPMALGLGYTGICFWSFQYNLVMAMTTPLLTVFLGAASCFLYLVFTEGRDKRRVRTMLAQYVSPAMLSTVVENYADQLQAEVGSEECLSILFSDIRGFTNLSESLPAATVVEILNHYFSNMTEIIFRHDGTIDKFIGDAIMAFWGAPVRDDAHANKALCAAIDMHERLASVNNWLKERGYPEIAIGIGIHSGNVILGNIGSEQKLDYTIIGDNVNLASRLEGLTKQYGMTIVISENLRNQLSDPLPCFVLDLVRVKGKQEPICIYAPILDRDPAAAEELAHRSQVAFAHYLQREWEQAMKLYATLPADILKQTFTQRCRAYQQAPPPADWDGVHTLTSK